MQALVKKLKLLQVGDAAVRRNPLFYADAQREFEHLEQADLAERRIWTLNRLSAVLFPASRTGYGRIVRGGGDIASWPLLTKGEVRAAPAAFASGSQLFTLKASTGGTSGSPLSIVRSLRSIVVEQVCIDRMMQKVDRFFLQSFERRDRRLLRARDRTVQSRLFARLSHVVGSAVCAARTHGAKGSHSGGLVFFRSAA
jgi:hypothetical protein